MSDWLKWECAFKDGTTINQFDETGFETTFKIVQEKINEVTVFKLIGNENTYLVNLLNGSISVNNQVIHFFEDPNEHNFRLIFFKRRLVSPPSTSINTDYYLGFQTTINERNQKKLLKITHSKIFLVNES